MSIQVTAFNEIMRGKRLADYEANLPEDLTSGLPLFEKGRAALSKYPSLMNFMMETRCDIDNVIVYAIEDAAYHYKVEFNRWNPIFRCSSMIEALTLLPNIVKACRKLDWCNVWKDQSFDDMTEYSLGEHGNVVFLSLEAESG